MNYNILLLYWVEIDLSFNRWPWTETMWRWFWLPIFSFDFKILKICQAIICHLKKLTNWIVKNHKQTLKHFLLQLKILPNSCSEWMYITRMHMKQNTPFQTFLLWGISRRLFTSESKSSLKWNTNIFILNGAGLLLPLTLTSKFLNKPYVINHMSQVRID